MLVLYFLYQRICFWLLSWKRGQKKYKYFPNDYLGDVKTGKIKNVCFTGHRIEACSIWPRTRCYYSQVTSVNGIFVVSLYILCSIAEYLKIWISRMS
jgi:hypothetical protein